VEYKSEILQKIRNFGALQYDADRICLLLGLSGNEKNEFLIDFQNEDSTVYQFYNQGEALGEYNVDAELAKLSDKGDAESIELQEKLRKNRKVNKIKSEYFGV
jgi:hypothetical protein